MQRMNKRHLSGHTKETMLYLGFMLPAFMLIGCVTLYPAIYNVVLSFTDMTLRNGTRSFVGLRNYARLFSDAYAWEALGRTFIYMLIGASLRVLCGLGCALLLRRRTKVNLFTRTAIILPWVMSEIMVSAVWMWILNHRTGLLNGVIISLGGQAVGWLVEPALAMASIIAASMWKNLAYTYLLLFAALQGISPDLYEAAKIDGCGSWQSFRYITIDMIKPTLMVVMVMVSITAFGQFSLTYSLTGGGPVRATEFIGLYMHKQAFTYMDLGYGATIGVLVFVINVVMTLLYRNVLKSDT